MITGGWYKANTNFIKYLSAVIVYTKVFWYNRALIFWAWKLYSKSISKEDQKASDLSEKVIFVPILKVSSFLCLYLTEILKN